MQDFSYFTVVSVDIKVAHLWTDVKKLTDVAVQFLR